MACLRLPMMVLCTAVGLACLFTRSDAEIKPPHALRLCGDDFLFAYRFCCNFDYFCRHARKKRDTEKKPLAAVTSQLLAKEIIGKRKASMFLMSKMKGAKQKHRRSASNDNAVEECCYETCTLEEVREYSC